MDDFFINMAINAGIGAILVSIKNPTSAKAQQLKESLLHLADAIYAAFPRQ